MKVYGPSLAMTDDWEQRITQLGLTKTTHEYAIYQLFSTALGWSAWKAFLPDRFANLKLLITRAIRLLTAATIRPAHARPPHPTWVTAVRQIFRCYHQSTGQIAVVASLFSSLCVSIHPRRNKGHRCTWLLGGIVHWIGNPQSAQ